MPIKTVIEALREALFEEMQRDERVVLLGEDIGLHGGVFRATEGLFQAFGEHRVIDTPLAESGIVGVAIGAAINGLRPVAEIQFADYIYSAMDQIVNEAAKLRYRSNGTWGCPLVIRAPWGAGVHGGLYHSQSIEAFFAHVAGLKVVAPVTPYDVKGLLKASIRDEDPVIFLEHKKTYRLIKGEVPEGDYIVPIGKAEVKREGSDLTVIAYGLMLHYSLEAAEKVAKEGIDVEVVDLRTILPLDKKTILASVRKTGKVLIVHEDNKTGGFGGELAGLITEEAFEDLDGPIMRLAVPDVPMMPFNAVLEDFLMLNPEKIVAAIRQLAAY
ncbi:MAG: alpha-ketoacid dehydrogenase subunit beta [candidate division NC10 bacterium]|nr:alpha-ketoacid dehydrogenase subunit beta [candidate division NC10 bacterium]